MRPTDSHIYRQIIILKVLLTMNEALVRDYCAIVYRSVSGVMLPIQIQWNELIIISLISIVFVFLMRLRLRTGSFFPGASGLEILNSCL